MNGLGEFFKGEYKWITFYDEKKEGKMEQKITYLWLLHSNCLFFYVVYVEDLGGNSEEVLD